MSLVALVDPTRNPIELISPFNWDSIPVKETTVAPAVGADFTLTVPAGKKWLFYGWRGVLVTDANVANRTVLVDIAPDGTAQIANAVFAQAQAATQTHIYYFIPSTSPTELYIGAYGRHWVGCGLGQPIELPAGATIIVTINNKQAGDDWGNGASVVSYFYKEAPG